MTDLAPEHLAPFSDLLLALADDKLLIGHRNSDWTGLAPILEEDIAFSSLAQDEIAHAAAVYELLAPLIGTSADQIAFGREPDAYRCAPIVEVPDEFDFGTAIARRFLCDHFDILRLERLERSAHGPTAALCARLRAEEQVHVEHADSWVRRLGTGTDDSRAHLQRALNALAPLAAGLFEPVASQDTLVAAGVYPGDDRGMYDTWKATVEDIVRDAGLSLDLPAAPPTEGGGRSGIHTTDLIELLDEMCEVFREEPAASW